MRILPQLHDIRSIKIEALSSMNRASTLSITYGLGILFLSIFCDFIHNIEKRVKSYPSAFG